ncbi:hypothetical protein OUZ56_018800 [Daphnia magna]|uniref:Uncharacterized protein n=1 Tax=Daphnia magna TaxID=35525 RepID=A0ABQ9ZAJ9_9CRUS|nr:hypothetical protein OUZ56_018800 [Daphnia magna]
MKIREMSQRALDVLAWNDPKYDEKSGHPDYFSRSGDFVLNQTGFREKFCFNCPEPLYRIAFVWCDLNQDKRPPCEVIEVWLEILALHIAEGAAIPQVLLIDIFTYTGRSSSLSESTTLTEAISPEIHTVQTLR